MRPNQWPAHLLLGLSLTAITTGDVAKDKAGDYPQFVRLSLGGVHVTDGAGLKVFDPGQHYYLISTGDCDVSSLGLVLTPDPRDWGYDFTKPSLRKGLKRRTLPRLSGGVGVNIGESPEQVVRKLGSPPSIKAYNEKTRVRTYTYFAHIVMSGEGKRRGRGKQFYSAKYVFLRERLRSIQYVVSNEDGCD